MYRKILALAVVALLVCFAGCGKKDTGSETSVDLPTQAEVKNEPKVEYYANPLTGVEELTKEKSQDRIFWLYRLWEYFLCAVF